jgi:hypothetical protein
MKQDADLRIGFLNYSLHLADVTFDLGKLCTGVTE